MAVPFLPRKSCSRCDQAKPLSEFSVVRSGKGQSKWLDLVPYTLAELTAHLKRTMPPGFCWDDVLNGTLHLDHIIPVSAFNFTVPTDIDFQRCWALKNLRLLPGRENISKGAKLSKPFQPSFIGI